MTDTDESPDYERLSPADLLGSLMFLSGIALLVLSFFARSGNATLQLPRFWYRSEWLWPFVGIALAVAGGFVQRRQRRTPESWQPSLAGRRFQRIVLYTRQECHLCDVAKDTLHRFAEWLPEIEEIDIDTSADLRHRYGTSVPVVEIDGVERFRGIVNETLLRRLIEGAAPVAEAPEQPAPRRPAP